jgi:hypothetical protein
MANGVQALTPYNLQSAGSFFGKAAQPWVVTYDTPFADLTIATPSDPSRIYLIGWEQVSAVVCNMTFKSGVQTLSIFQFGVYSGQGEPYAPLNPGVILTTEPGQPLIINCDQALPTFQLVTTEL